jgi:hypothetical protein
MKPGFKSTEFILTMLAVLLGGLGPFLAAGTVLEKVVGLIVAGLASIGYGAGRSLVKANEQKSIAAQAISAGHSKASPPSL